MLVLITGGPASGKSEFAENRAVRLSAETESSLLYIATMQPFDAECERRIARHREQRAGKGFLTAECYTNLPALALPPHPVALLECMSNLTANELYSPEGAGSAARAEQRILAGVDRLLAACPAVVVVSNELFSDGAEYDPSTREYLALLGRVNQALAARADEVYEVVCGIPLRHKPLEQEARPCIC